MSDTAVRERSGIRRHVPLLSRLSWTTADQMVSSGTNAAVSLLVARQVSAEEFGAFALAFVAFTYAIGASRALVSEPLVVRFSGTAGGDRLRAIGDSAGAALLTGVTLGAVAAGVGLVVPGLTGTLLVALGCLMPALVLQDHWRLAFFASGRPKAAFINDSVWALLQIGTIVLLIWGGRGETLAYLLAWGGSAAAAAVLGIRQAGTRPRLGSSATGWLRAHRDLGGRFAGSFLVNQGAFNTAEVLLGVIVGVAAVGAVRGVAVLLGPMRVVFSTVTAFALPLLSRRVSAGQAVVRPAAAVSLAAGGLAAVWAGGLVLLPASVGEELLGETWEGASTVLPILGLQWVVIGVATGAALGLKALAHARLLLRVTLVQGPLAIALGAGGALLGGLVGAATGLLLAQTTGALLIWWLLLRNATPARSQ